MGGRKSAFLDFLCQQEYSTKISSKKILRVNSHDLLIYSDGHIYQRMKVYFRNSIPIISIPTKKMTCYSWKRKWKALHELFGKTPK